jgi:hypothetical protein
VYFGVENLVKLGGQLRHPVKQSYLIPPVAETGTGKLVVRANLIGDTDFYTELVKRIKNSPTLVVRL